MRKGWWWAGVAVVALAGAVTAALVSRAATQKKAEEDAKAQVTLEFTAREVVRPALAAMPLRIEFSGPLVAPSTAIVRAKAPGTLVSLAVAEGSRVRAGQSLGSIDLADLASRVAERQAMVESARAQLAQAERTHGSNQRLADQDYISPNALEGSRAALQAAKAALDAAQAQLATSRVGLRDAALVAPISGLVSKRHVVPGEKLSAEQPVLTLVDLARLELAGSVATHEVSVLQPGMTVALRIEGVEQPASGTVARIAPAAEAGTRSIGVAVDVANPKEQYRAGQYAVARVELADTQQRLTLPTAAVTQTAGQDQVWVIDQGRLARRAITTGRRDEARGLVEVLAGLDAQAQVLAARFDNLPEGGKAVVQAGQAGASVAAAAASSVAR